MGAANYDVVVVGAGEAGLSVAIGLAKADFAVLVLESAAFPGGPKTGPDAFILPKVWHRTIS